MIASDTDAKQLCPTGLTNQQSIILAIDTQGARKTGHHSSRRRNGNPFLSAGYGRSTRSAISI